MSENEHFVAGAMLGFKNVFFVVVYLFVYFFLLSMAACFFSAQVLTLQGGYRAQLL